MGGAGLSFRYFHLAGQFYEITAQLNTIWTIEEISYLLES